LLGHREDSGFQLQDRHTNIDVSCNFLDNYFEEPNLSRFLETFKTIEPSVAVIGDAYSRSQAERFEHAIDHLRDHGYRHNRLVVVPKSPKAAAALDDDTIRGYANGYSDVQGEEIGLEYFREHPVHILGSAPDKQYSAIQRLVQPRLDGIGPAEIVGGDWNGYMRSSFAEPGEYWTPDGWQEDTPGASPRETCRKSLEQIKQFWESKGMWPETAPRELYGEAVTQPDEPVYAGSGGDIRTREELETAVVEEYDTGVYAFESETEQAWIEYREGLTG
jgi:hypothetical protein